MSPIALPIAELKPALAGLGKIIAKRPSLPVLGHLKIERTEDGWIVLTATDLERFVSVRLEQPSEGAPVELLVPYDELLKLTRACPKTDSILLRGEGRGPDRSVAVEYAVGHQLAERKFSSLPVEEFPEIPEITGVAIPLNDALRQSIHQALECASSDETRLVLNSAFIDVSHKEGHSVVGTNGSHLFSSNSFKLPLKESVIIPSHRFLGFKDFNQDGEWQLQVKAPQHKDDSPLLRISSRRWSFTGRQFDGNYPNWRQVIPALSQFTDSIEFDAEQLEALADSIDRLPDHDAKDHAIGIERHKNAVSLLWKPDMDQDWKRLPVSHGRTPRKDLKLFLNRQYLTKALRFGLGHLQVIDAMSPMRFSHQGRQMIVMPVRSESSSVATTPEATPPPAPPQEPATETQKEKPAMPTATTKPTNRLAPTPASPASETPKTALESALIELDEIRTQFRNAVTGLTKLGEHLRQVQREQKTGEKEIQSVRATLRSLQSVRI